MAVATDGDDGAMEFLDPRGTPLAPIEPYRGRAALATGEMVALFANGFPDSVAFLEHIGRALSKELPGVDVKLWNKGNASALASQQHLGEIQAECTAVVAAYGH
jgi:hypothetical protein